jgi:outer membrane protein assembly factor BamC
METDWAENRAKIPQDMIRRFLGNTLDSIYSTGERDKFRTRLEKNTNTETEVYVTHRGAEEKLVGSNPMQADSTMWTARAADPELEAEMLARMMVYLGTNYESAKAELAKNNTSGTARTSRVTEVADAAQLSINQGFDKTWREVGLALDRSNFTVEDRDRSQGIYFVRFVNTKDVDPKSSGSWFSNMFKSSKEEELRKAKRYRVVVKGDSTKTIVTALEDNGTIVKGDVDQQILKIIDAQVSY